MLSRTCLLVSGLIAGSLSQQIVDDFQCPDEFEGFYPHLVSCDKYWHCKDNVPTLKTCGNGLAFLDTDETFTLEQCEEIPLVDCGLRTELEPPISTTYCPRLYGTFADPESCSVFYKCLDGKANRYECPPGLAYDQVSRGCKWADQVPECKRVILDVDPEDGEAEEFKCPAHSAVGTFTKHAHPADCRQYFVCIGGVPREYGCPLGTVFKIGDDEFSGKCTDPEEVAECQNYYGDIEFDPVELSRSGADTGRISENERVRSSAGAHAFRKSAVSNNIPSSNPEKPREPSSRRRPSPPALQAIVDGVAEEAIEPVAPVVEARPVRPQRPRPVRPRPVPTTQPPTTTTTTQAPTTTTTFFRPEPEVFNLSPITERPASRFQVLTDRPVVTPGFIPQQQPATGGFAPVENSRPPFTAFNNNPVNAPAVAQPVVPSLPSSVVTLAPDDAGLPDPVPAKPGPNGEEYYYYYYYYDDESPVPDEE